MSEGTWNQACRADKWWLWPACFLLLVALSWPWRQDVASCAGWLLLEACCRLTESYLQFLVLFSHGLDFENEIGLVFSQVVRVYVPAFWGRGRWITWSRSWRPTGDRVQKQPELHETLSQTITHILKLTSTINEVNILKRADVYNFWSLEIVKWAYQMLKSGTVSVWVMEKSGNQY